MTFQELKLIPSLLEAVRCCGYQQPTPIQRETIPPVIAGRDVLGCAQTGTGKTAAFALPILQRLFQEGKPAGSKRPIRALILTPTRELALQIYENFEGYGKKLPLRPCVIFGGVGQQPQVDQLKRGVDILVATPGRLNDLIGQGFIKLDKLEVFVLDEADRMLDMGFIHDVKKVISHLPQKRQTLFFSATMPPEVEKLATSLLTDPVTVKVDPVSSTVDRIDQSLYMVDKANKRHLLAKLLRAPDVESALVFTRTKHGADRVVRELSREHIEARAIHGNKSQTARQQALSDFKSGKVRVMVATDIAARGIDIAGLSHVFNYDLPNEPEAYVHRIGRTGRAGRDGIAISFCCIDEMKELKQIEKLTGKTLKRLESEWPMQVFEETVKQPRPPRPGREPQPAKAESRQQTKEEKKHSPRAEKPASKPQKAKETPKAQPSQHKPAKAPALVTEMTPAPQSKATPLERPVSVAPRKEQPPRSIQRDQSEKPAFTYAELLKQRRKESRRPLSTGNDRF